MWTRITPNTDTYHAMIKYHDLFPGMLALKAFDDCKGLRVNTKLAFTDQFFYNSIILIK